MATPGKLRAQPIRRPAFNPGRALPWVCAVWADDPAWARPSDGGQVASWRDCSGNGHDIVQATSGKQPKFRASTSELAGRGSVESDGVDDLLSVSLTDALTAFSLVWVGKKQGVGSNNNDAIIVTQQVSFTELCVDTSTGKWMIYGGSTVDSTVSYDTTAGHAIRTFHNSASSAINVDGTNTTGNAGSSNHTDIFQVGAHPGAVAFGFFRHAFAALYLGDVTTDRNWPGFKQWVNRYYRLTIA